MAFSTLFTSVHRGALASAVAFAAIGVGAPTPGMAHEPKASATLRSSDAALLSKQRLGLPVKEVKRGNAYAPLVWMPEGASVKLGDSEVAFGLARLNPLVRRSFGLASSEVGAIAAPVMSMQLTPTSSVTFITIMGDANGGMLAWQMKL